MRKYFYIIIAIIPFIWSGCEGSRTTTSTTSAIAKLSAFSFAKNDSMPGLAAATFTIEERIDTGLVWNKDSILYGTRLDSVVPRFVFAATPARAVITTPDTVCALTGYDTLNFSKQPIYLTILSSDRTTTKVYEIRPTVHQVDPDLYTWVQLTEGVYPADDSEQRVVEIGDRFVMVVSNGFELRAFASDDGAGWSDLGEPEGLPAGTRVRQIISDGNTLYYASGTSIYTSSDAIHWTADNVGYTVVTMVLYWNKKVWVLTDDEGYELAIYENGALLPTGLTPTEDFPVSDFGAVCFQSASERERAMIIGGFAEDGRALNSRWNLEYTVHPKPEGQYRMEEFSIDRPQFTSLTGISVIWYNHQLLLFGGVDEKMSYFGREIMISKDEGLNWDMADAEKNQLPEVYTARQKQTAIVRDNYIYLFGGQDAQRTYSDVYKGRLNSIEW